MRDQDARVESANPHIESLLRGDNPTRSMKKIAERAAGGRPTITTDDWIVALPELEGVAVEFTHMDSIRDSYLWHDGEAYRASNLAFGLEDREGRPLSRIEAAALLDGSVPALSEPVSLSEVDDAN